MSPHTPAKILRSIVIKPTGSFCNLRCAYCFYLDTHSLYEGAPSTHRMSEAVLEQVIRHMFVCSDSPSFVWQGGEPTVLGVDFFRHAAELQRFYAKGRSYSNALQTHGGLLDEEWADFLKKENYLVGLSLDGPRHVHDRYRLDPQGRGTFQRTFDNARMLLDAGVPVNALSSVSDYAVRHPEEIYRFFRDNGFIFMQFSPVVETDDGNPAAAAAYSVGAREYGRFLSKLFDLWVEDFDFDRLQQKTSIRFFDSLLQVYLDQVPDHCVLHKHCNDYLVVEHNGDLFSCDFLVSEDTRLGNLSHISLQDAFNSEAHTAFGRRKAAYGQECRQCQWLKMCYGGCIKDRLRDPADQGHNHFCESYKHFFQRSHQQFGKFARLYRRYYLNQN